MGVEAVEEAAGLRGVEGVAGGGAIPLAEPPSGEEGGGPGGERTSFLGDARRGTRRRRGEISFAVETGGEDSFPVVRGGDDPLAVERGGEGERERGVTSSGSSGSSTSIL